MDTIQSALWAERLVKEDQAVTKNELHNMKYRNGPREVMFIGPNKDVEIAKPPARVQPRYPKDRNQMCSIQLV